MTDNEIGLKFDAGKPMAGTVLEVFPLAILAIGACIESGTHKYPDSNNWKKVKDAKRKYLNSAMRHLLKHYAGVRYDKETGLPHLAHCAWNTLAILQLLLMDEEMKNDVDKLLE